MFIFPTLGWHLETIEEKAKKAAEKAEAQGPGKAAEEKLEDLDPSKYLGGRSSHYNHGWIQAYKGADEPPITMVTSY